MKVIVSILFVIIAHLGAAATDTVSNSAAAKCGSLGVMSTANLPEGVNAADVRPCANHPFGHKRSGEQSLAPMSNADLAAAATYGNSFASGMVQQDACYFDAPYGCSKNTCWKSCGPRGSGQWCWLAAQNGVGPWMTCTSFKQCNLGAGYDCGRNCKPNSKLGCGCSC